MSKEKTVSVEPYTGAHCRGIINKQKEEVSKKIKELNKSTNDMDFKNAKEKKIIENNVKTAKKILSTLSSSLDKLKFED